MNTPVTNYKPKYSAAELKNEITKHIEELAKATDSARVSEEMTRYLDICSRFHQYSPCNVWMILMHKPEASYVSGYKKWQTLNRFVRKGEKGIPILAPLVFKENKQDPNSDEVLMGFKVVYVYDVSQTDGDPLPDPPDWKSPEKNKELEEKFIQFANSKEIQVSVVKQAGEIQGVSKGGSIEIDPSAGTKTLIHEIAHELMHRDENSPVESCLRELEAESVAYIVCNHFGLEISSSPNYIALHGADSEMIKGHLERIRKTAMEVIGEVEKSEFFNCSNLDRC